jgi:hypothetical protein
VHTEDDVTAPPVGAARHAAPVSIPPVGKLSQAIAEGDGITILVQADDAATAGAVEEQGADGLVTHMRAGEVRAASQLPLLHLGGLVEASTADADAVVVAVDAAAWDEGHALGLECVVRVSQTDELERALEELDPAILLLSPRPDPDEDLLEELLALLHDVPAGKLAIAELHHATAHDVAELERAGVDAVLVAPGDVAALVPVEPPDV